MALIIRKTSQDSSSSAFAATLNFTYPVTPTSGNMLIVSVYGNTGNAITLSDNGSNTGWASTNFNFETTFRQLYVFYKISDGTEATITVAQSSASVMAVHGYEYQNIANPIVTDTSQKVEAATATSLQTGTLTNTNPVDLIFATWAMGSSIGSPSVSSGYKLLTQNTHLVDAQLISTTKSGYYPTLSWTTSSSVGSIIIAFNGTQVQGAADSGSNFSSPHIIVGDGMSRSEMAN